MKYFVQSGLGNNPGILDINKSMRNIINKLGINRYHP
jgi:hypothetical protein